MIQKWSYDYAWGIERAHDGDWVRYIDHEAVIRAHVALSDANLAEVQARALAMEATIARVREMWQRMDGDPAYGGAADALRAALEGA